MFFHPVGMVAVGGGTLVGFAEAGAGFQPSVNALREAWVSLVG
jgi:hypothetical protein